MIKKAENWNDYECIDAGDFEKLERWKEVILRRPDPLAIWPKNKKVNWNQYDAIYHRSKSGGGSWSFKQKLPNYWTIDYKNLRFKVSPTGFKHTGLFPEQAANWDWMHDLIQSRQGKETRILNLFAYTGGATLACAEAGASEVVHVDASKGMVQWAKENRDFSHLQNHKIRFIVEDCLKFVEREQRRGRTYHGILMDPPSYGRGPNGEMWKFEKEVMVLIEKTLAILDEDALFFLVNSYTTGFSSTVFENLFKTCPLPEGKIETGELGLPVSSRDIILPAGIYARWQKQ